MKTLLSIPFLTLFSSLVAHAAEKKYTPLQPIVLPGQSGNLYANDIPTFLNNIFTFGIAIAGALAVLQIVIAGITYMMSDAFTSKADAKGKIKDALMGLGLALCAYIILFTINPDLVKIQFNLTKAVAPAGEVKAAQAENGYTSTYNPANGVVSYQPGDPNAFPDLASYQQNGWVTVTDNSGYTGKISPEVAYMRDKFPGQFQGLESESTYRSAEHNAKIGGSSTSDHLSGKGIDFGNDGSLSSSAFSQKGNEMVDYLLQNGRGLGVDQIIFEDKNYKWSDEKNGWIKGNPVGGHNDHVHVGT